MKYFYLFVLVFPILFFSSCADNIVSECDEENPPAQLRSKLSSIQQVVFSDNCAKSGCHAGVNPQEGLNLSSVQLSYDNLVNVQSNQNPQFKRVLPDSSAKSWLIKKLNGDGTSLMPADGTMLSQAIIDSIAAWIDNGAENN